MTEKAQTAKEVADAIREAKSDIRATLGKLAERLPDDYALDRCDVDVRRVSVLGGAQSYMINIEISTTIAGA